MVFEKIVLSVGDGADTADTANTVAPNSLSSGFVGYPAVLLNSLTEKERERQQEIYQRAYTQAHAAMAADDHVLRSHLDAVAGLADELAAAVTDEVLERATALVPDEWLVGPPSPNDLAPDELRAAYCAFLRARRDGTRAWLPRRGAA